MALDNGLRIWDSKRQKLYVLDSENGLPNNSVSSILEDDYGILWVSCVNGISKIEVVEKPDRLDFSIINFSTIDGLQSGKFNERAALRASNGTFYFGGVYGFNSFNPHNIIFNQSKHKAVFTSLSLFNRNISPTKAYNGRVILPQSLNRVQEVVLKHNENFISLEFAGLNYTNPKRTYFRYKLLNFDTNWTEIITSGAGKVTYTELAPGNYKLIVYTANNDKVWSDAAADINIIIKPPFWATTIAYAFYLILFVGIVAWGISYLHRLEKKKLLKQQLINEQRQQKELEQMKYSFFTNVSHEFRTPLTLIITPLEAIIKSEKSEEMKARLSTIYLNAQSLLSLVNQLLDFRKLEMKGEKLKLYKINVNEFIQNVYDQFEYAVRNKELDFILETEVDSLTIYLDENKIHKVMNNLLSNALKHTPQGGAISIIVSTVHKGSEDYLKISVSDTGSGIPEADREKIFDRFYQSEGNNQRMGTGIGLHLTKEYIQLHQGEISVANQPGGGAVFSILIPTNLKGDESEKMAAHETQVQQLPQPDATQGTDQTLLVVEDNEAFRQFLVEQLSGTFTVIEAANGREGEEIALQKLPDLIISDLMMPHVDGITLCRRLKSNIQTSHIPFILLTARSSDEARVEGYEAGADSYISKPFSMDVLLTRIKNLIEQQQQRREIFQKNIEVSPGSITITSLDEEMVQKALNFVEKNMDNTDYSVEDLSQDIGLSRVHLYRKLQSITGQTPSDFIRSIRLKRAAQLLQSSQLNVSEIAYAVGFNTPKYFTKYFREEFGMTPSQYRTENIND